MLGILRGRGDCLRHDFDIWVGGYPRSSNSFATAALRLGNPQLRVATHLHIPPFIINAVRANKPGLLIVRPPRDAALSWAIFWEGRITIEQALDYYLDFHQALRPLRQDIFVASFEETTTAFDSVLRRLNHKLGASFVGLPKSAPSTDRCLSYVEDWFRSSDGSLNEFRVPRPSVRRAEVKRTLEKKIQTSHRILKKLQKADELYFEFTRFEDAKCSTPLSGSAEDAVVQPSACV